VIKQIQCEIIGVAEPEPHHFVGAQGGSGSKLDVQDKKLLFVEMPRHEISSKFRVVKSRFRDYFLSWNFVTTLTWSKK
jgi:hypothetical protein